MAGRKRKSAPVAEEKAPVTTEAPASRRRSQRISLSAQNEKSKYFEHSSDSDTAKKETPSAKPRVRGRPSKKAKTKEAESESDQDEEYDNEAQDVEQKAESDDEIDEDAPPKVTFIPLPKMRDTGGIEYADDRLHPNTLAFLSDLKANNKRTWLKANDKEYRRALKDWETYVTALTDKIVALDPTVPELPFKDVNFRIYRDIRFSHDPTPYKPHFAAAFSRTGRKGPYACYYVHVEPNGSCFIGGGLWHPDSSALHKLRASIDERPRRWRRVLNERGLKEVFLFPGKDDSNTGKKGKKVKGKGKSGGGEGDGDGEEAALKAFADANQGNALKTRPKGFVAEHRDMQLLKLRNFVVMKKVGDSMFTAPGGLDEVAGVIGAMVGFVTHLNRVVMPDPDDDDEESDEE